MKLAVDEGRLVKELEALAQISQAPAPAVTRVVYTEADVRGRAFVKKLCAEAGLTLHVDAIPNAGLYDGTVGVLGGLEAIRALQKAGVRPTRSIELLIFAAEEPTRFGIGCLGSRLLSGLLDKSAGTRLKDRDGVT